MGASTAGAAQSVAAPVRAPEPAVENVTDGSALNSAETLGTVFGLLVIVILIWKLGDNKGLTPAPPTSP
jgi:hypothetical protein